MMNGNHNNNEIRRMDDGENSQQQIPGLPFLLNGGIGRGQSNPANTLFSNLNGSNGLTPANIMGLAGGNSSSNHNNGLGPMQGSSLFSAFQRGNLRSVQDGGGTSGGTSIEDQILQRASALRAEALRQQQQQQQPQNQEQAQQHQRMQLEAALVALQQQHQLSSLASLGILSTEQQQQQQQQQQEAFFSHAAALRNLGLAAAIPGSNNNNNAVATAEGLERLQQQLDISRAAEEEMERARQIQQQMSSLLAGSGRSEADTTSKLSLQGEEIQKETDRRRAGLTNTFPDKKGPMNQDDQTRMQSMLVSSSKNKHENMLSVEDVSETLPAEAKNMEELRKRPGTVIVPCRARGMPMDHNFKTAYFVISENAKHGEDLVCSYFACRNGGVKFRYCAHCMAPVAKRNFSRRHDHGMTCPVAGGVVKDSDSEDEDDDDDGDDDDNEMDENESTVDVVDQAMQKESAGDKHKKRRRPDDVDGAVKSTLDIAEGSQRRKSNGSLVSSKRRAMWSNLLARRPRTKDPRNLSSWLNEVLAVSDLDFPIDEKVLSGMPSETDSEPTESKIPGLGSNPGEKKNTAVMGSDSYKKRDAGETKKKGGGKGMRKVIKTSHKDSSSANKRPLPQDGRRELSEDHNGGPNIVPKEHDGFVPSFADWRGRKKATKKGPSSLKK